MNIFNALMTVLTATAGEEVTEAVTETVTDVAGYMSSTLTFGERIGMGIKVVLFGMAVVFAVLALLWGILEIFRIVFYEIPKKKAAEEAAKAAANTPAVQPEEPVDVSAAEEIDEAEIVAAITAAIAVVMDKPQTAFRVVSFRRTASK